MSVSSYEESFYFWFGDKKQLSGLMCVHVHDHIYIYIWGQENFIEAVITNVKGVFHVSREDESNFIYGSGIKSVEWRYYIEPA